MIALGQQHLNEIREHGERDYPFECCGLLIGRFEPAGRKVVLETYPISNAREEEAKRKLAETEKKRTPVVHEEIETPLARLNIREVLENLIVHDDGIPPTKLEDWATRIDAKYSEIQSLDWPKHTSTRSGMRVEMKRLLSALGFPRDRRDVAVDKIVGYLEAEYIEKNNLNDPNDFFAAARSKQTASKVD